METATATATKRLYEAMFLVDSAQAAGDWEGTMGVIETVLKRADADVVSLRKWSERRLAYDIGKVSRGTYLLCYFRAEPSRIIGLEKDVRLSESIMRLLILSAEDRPEGFNEKDMVEELPEDKKESTEAPGKSAEAPTPEAASETKDTPPAESAEAPAPEAASETKDTPPAESAEAPAPEAAATETEAAPPAESVEDAAPAEEVKEQ